MKGSLIIIGAAVLLVLCASAIAVARERTATAWFQLIGSVFLTIMVLTHFAEAFHLFPQMGWGRPHTAGHYIDLISAWGGVALLAIGYFRRKLRRI